MLKQFAIALFSTAALVMPATAYEPAATAAHNGTNTAMEKADIVDTAVNAGMFDTLVAAVQAAGLEATLRSDGPFTVFAPTDAAFEKLPEGTVAKLLKPENKDKLISILTYHVVSGKVMSGDIAGKKLKTDTVNGAMLKINATDGVMVGNATVTKADIETSNGVIHVIDTVLIPQEKKMKSHRSGS
jgi:Secreted and surface protein containing fasciclin-like repeats